jgi:hypothetical protein
MVNNLVTVEFCTNSLFSNIPGSFSFIMV